MTYLLGVLIVSLVYALFKSFFSEFGKGLAREILNKRKRK